MGPVPDAGPSSRWVRVLWSLFLGQTGGCRQKCGGAERLRGGSRLAKSGITLVIRPERCYTEPETCGSSQKGKGAHTNFYGERLAIINHKNRPWERRRLFHDDVENHACGGYDRPRHQSVMRPDPEHFSEWHAEACERSEAPGGWLCGKADGGGIARHSNAVGSTRRVFHRAGILRVCSAGGVRV